MTAQADRRPGKAAAEVPVPPGQASGETCRLWPVRKTLSPPLPSPRPQAGVERVTEDRAVSSSSCLPRPGSTGSVVSSWKPHCQKPLLSSSGLSFTSIYLGSPSDMAAGSRLAASPCHSRFLKGFFPDPLLFAMRFYCKREGPA